MLSIYLFYTYQLILHPLGLKSTLLIYFFFMVSLSGLREVPSIP